MNLVQTLALEIPLAIALVVVCDRLARAGREVSRPARLITVLWIPLLMVLPALGISAAGSEDLSLRSLVAISSGPLIAAMAMPLLIIGGGIWKLDHWHADDRIPLAWPAVGVLLLCLAVAGRVPEFVMIVAFAVGAVLLWMETLPRAGEQHGGEGGVWAAVGVVLSGGLVFVGSQSTAGWPVLCVSLGSAGLIVWRTWTHLGQRQAIVSTGWAAMIGPVLAIGLLGQRGLQATLLNTFGSDISFVGYRTLSGLEMLLMPGVMLLFVCGLIAGWARWSARRGRLAAVLMAGLGIFMTAVLMSGLGL